MTFNKTAPIHCTCDDIFDTLTRGPFPTGDACIDEPTERHLQCCHACRTLAEAFRPATEVLEESLPHDVSSDLPVYQGAYWEQQSVSWEPVSPKTQTQSSQYIKPMAVLAASILVLIFVGGWGSSANFFASQIPSSFHEPADTQELAKQHLMSLSLPVSCVSAPIENAETPFVHAGHLSGLQCCSECHNAGVERDNPLKMASLTSGSLLAIVDSCRACHTQ
ncbi:MAG: hypothetical protein ACKVH8_24755 [Pirellulales bacterium]